MPKSHVIKLFEHTVEIVDHQGGLATVAFHGAPDSHFQIPLTDLEIVPRAELLEGQVRFAIAA